MSDFESGLRWVKSSRSIGANACIELALDGDRIMLRDSKCPGIQLSYTHAEIDAFLYGAKNGEFDHLLQS